jgi:hypothetical protein
MHSLPRKKNKWKRRNKIETKMKNGRNKNM